MKKYRTNKAQLFFLFIISLSVACFLWRISKDITKITQAGPNEEENRITVPIRFDRIEKIEISDGATYGVLMASTSLAYADYMAVYEVAAPVYDLVKIRVGRILELVFDKKTDEFKELKYKIDSEDELHVRNGKYYRKEGADGWQAEIEPIPYELKIKTAAGTVESSMYQAALDNDIDIRAIIELADAFQWTIDFAMDPRVGDTFRFIYEERFLDGKYEMPGRILAGRYVNDNKPYDVYYFEEDEDNKGYFDSDGNSVQKMFLKAPVAFRYISSGFTTGLRYVEAFNVATGHRAIDYAAPQGTPIRSVGDGTVVSAGWNRSGYGNLTSIRHNGTYSTNYAHQSKIIVKRGQKVKQGEVIGYVGSTGFSTGPHLHFEMLKNGAKVNPLREILPPGQAIADGNKARFFEEIKKWQEELNKKN